MPTKYEFEQTIVDLEEAINCFKKSQRRFNNYKLYLSNGKVLEFTFDGKNIPHLLGINIGNLKTSKILSSDKPLEMLEELIDRYTAIYQKMERGEISYNDIFSPYVKEKIKFFKLIFNFHSSNILGVCRYSAINSYLNGDTNTYRCDYYIIFDDDENFPYFLGLKEDRINDYYAPSSVIGNFDETSANNSLKSIISNQQIMLVNNVFRTNTGEKYYVTNAEKLIKVQKLRTLAQNYGSHLILDNDYMYNLRKMMAFFENESKTSQFLSDLTLALVQRKKVKMTEGLDESCKQLAMTYNSQVLPNSENALAILSELKSLKEELLQAKETIKTYEQTISSQQSTIAHQAETIKSQQQELDSKEKAINSLSQFKEDAFQLFKKYTN